ncbi:MAG: hypothetical protein M0R80_22210 [Proteobacteria bacterium]|jgi:hypothetical protein|nr:hypothetical protein [Pseudomonadota bacterium]
MSGGEHNRGVGLARRLALPLAYVLLLAAYAAAMLYWEPPAVLLADEPLSGRDLDTHIEQVWRVTETLDGFRKSWAWDPQMLAGSPQGVIFDADNKGWELWTFALTRLGVGKGLAFNLFIALAHLLLPIVLYSSARLFDLGRAARFVVVALGLCVWCFDSFIHWAWWEGMVAYAMASYLCLLPLALFHRFTSGGKLRYAIALAPVMGALHLAHPYSFFILAVPMIAMYARRFRAFGRREHAAIAGIVVVTLAMNAWWLLVDLRFWHYILNSGYLGATTIGHLATDYVGIVLDRAVSGGAGMRSGFRFLAMGAAAVSLFYWRADRDPRFWAFATGLGALFVAGYLGGYIPPLLQVQPYRFTAPLAFLALIPAAQLVERIAASGALRGLPPRVYVVGAIAVFVAIPRLARDVMYFLPPLVPEARVLEDERPKITDAVGFSNIGYPRQIPYRHTGMDETHAALAEWVAARVATGEQGRYLVENWTIGELLAWKTEAEVLGGFRLRNLQHSAANFFRLYPVKRPPEGTLKAYMKRYGVRYVVTSVTHGRFLAEKKLLRKVAEFPPHIVFESRLKVSYFAEGSGEVAASMNRIAVRGSTPDEDVVLRYHWIETFACEPDCRVERERLKGDPVGFVRIPAPHPADFEIVNRY